MMLGQAATRLIILLSVSWSANIASAQELPPLPLPRPDRTPVRVAPIPNERPIWLNQMAGESGVAVSLADAIFLGLRENRSIKSAYISRTIQKFDLQAAQDAFLPKLRVRGEVSQQFTEGAAMTSIVISPGMEIQTSTGATFQFVWNNAYRNIDGSASGSSIAELSLEQPLLRGAGQEITMAPVQSAFLADRVARLQLRAAVTDTVGQIIFAYRDLALAQAQKRLAETSVARARNLLTINAALIAAGRMASIEAVQAEADVERQQLQYLRAEQRVEIARLTLADLLALDLNTKIVANEELNPTLVSFDLAQLMAIALAQRPDYLGQLNVIQQNRLGFSIAQNEQLWDLAVFAKGRVGSEFSGAMPPAAVADVTVGLRFNIPIDDPAPERELGVATAEMQQGEVQLLEIRQGIELQIRTSVSEIEMLWKQLIVATKAYELAGRAFDIETEKLNLGRSSNFEVRSFEAALREAEHEALNARIGYVNALTRLDLQLGTALNTWQIVLGDE